MKLKGKILLCFAILSIAAQAGTVSDLIDYQLYRDFAMNKGKFKVGETDIVIKRKDGVEKTIKFKMPDFSSTDSSGVGTLYDPSYIGGVRHNGGFTKVTYGQKAGHTYKLVDRNNHSSWDAHAPRLNKLVTDVAPSTLKETSSKPSDYEVFVRVGSGTQYIQTPDGKKQWVSGAYQFLTGGIIDGSQMNSNWTVADKGGNFNNAINSSSLPISIEAGDSGSPLWGFNKYTQKWELVAFGVAVSGSSTLYAAINKEFYESKIAEDTLEEFIAKENGEEIIWGATGNYNDPNNKNRGTGVISQGDYTLEYNGLNPELHLNNAVDGALNHGKHIIFGGAGGTIRLEDSINQGAGKLHFKNDYLVTANDKDTSWVGAGIQIDKDKIVTWELKGVKDDNLHKIGEGTLHVKGTGINEGGLNVGDGLVILEQQADENGNLQAFSGIDIVSGRATVRLTDDKQIDTSKIRFGFRGGRLDLYGNAINFGDIKASDSGAKIVNDNEDKKAIANINTDNFKGNVSIFHGQFGESDESKTNGELDINIGGTSDINKTFAITGGSNLNGNINLTSENTTLILSGERDLHAGEDIKKTQLKGDYLYSEFNFNNLNMAAGSTLYGSVYSAINGNINTEKNNNVTLGYLAGESKYVYDKTQETWEQTATEEVLTSENTGNIFNTITTFFKGELNINNDSSLRVGYTDIEGNINLKNNSNAYLKNSILTGAITGDSTSDVKFDNSIWYATNTSNLGNLDLNFGNIVLGNNSKIDGDIAPLNITEEEYGKINVEKLSGNGSILFNVDLDSGKGGKLNVDSLGEKGLDLDISIVNTGEDSYGKSIDLISFDKINSNDKISISSEGKEYIDIGAIRGEIKVDVASDETGKVILITKDYLTKNTASDMANTSLSNWTAKTSVIKSQKNILQESLGHMNKERFISRISYKGNYSDGKYESDKFREFSQSIINHGVSFEDVKYLKEWDFYRGLAFLYGKSNVDFDGDYSGEIETYSANLYGKLLNDNGTYIKGLFGLNYIETSINEDKEKGYSFTLGNAIGVEKEYKGLKLMAETNLNLFYFPNENYTLKSSNFNDTKNYKVQNKEAYVVELNPEIKLSKDFNLKEDLLSLYLATGYEYNFYLNNDGAEVKVDGLNGKTGIIENGVSIKAGAELQVKNVTLGAEAKVLSGSDNSEKLTGSLKMEIKF